MTFAVKFLVQKSLKGLEEDKLNLGNVKRPPNRIWRNSYRDINMNIMNCQDIIDRQWVILHSKHFRLQYVISCNKDCRESLYRLCDGEEFFQTSTDLPLFFSKHYWQERVEVEQI